MLNTGVISVDGLSGEHLKAVFNKERREFSLSNASIVCGPEMTQR